MKKVLLILAALAVVGVIAGYLIYNQPHKDIRSAPADVSISATNLFNAFQSDEAAANEKFLDKIIEVTGTVVEVKKGEDGEVSVTLDGGGMVFGVICKMDQLTTHKRTDFKTGEQLTLKGICTGVLMDVVLTRCVEI